MNPFKNAACQRLSSTTTRIKTAVFVSHPWAECPVRDYLPLQQGLRPNLQIVFAKLFFIVRDYLPLQQGLRQKIRNVPLQGILVRDYLPLQQGLRRG